MQGIIFLSFTKNCQDNYYLDVSYENRRKNTQRITRTVAGLCCTMQYSVESNGNADNDNKPTIIVEYGMGKEAGLIKVTHLDYAKSEAKGKPSGTGTCYGLTGWKWSDLPIEYTVSPGYQAFGRQ